jgi:hypothetical protein
VGSKLARVISHQWKFLAVGLFVNNQPGNVDKLPDRQAFVGSKQTTAIPKSFKDVAALLGI